MSTVLAKHRQIFEAVRSKIESGHYQPGDRIPTDMQLVAEFKVSRPTVARALRDLEICGLVSRRPGSGTYVLDLADTKETKTFGLLVPGLGQTEIFDPICAEIGRRAQEAHHSVVWGASTSILASQDEENGAQALEVCQRYIRDKVDGVFLAPLVVIPNRDEVNRKIISSLQSAGIPVVLLDRDFVTYPERSNLDLVGIDNRRVGNVAATHLMELGCRRLHFVAHPFRVSTVEARIAGFTEALIRNRIELTDPYIHYCDPRETSFIKKLLSSNPDGIVCGNDITAGQLMHGLHDCGTSVPDDIRVVGIDDVKYAELLRVPLTTIRQPCQAIGAAAFRAMLERMENPDMRGRDILIGFDLITRESCGTGAAADS